MEPSKTESVADLVPNLNLPRNRKERRKFLRGKRKRGRGWTKQFKSSRALRKYGKTTFSQRNTENTRKFDEKIQGSIEEAAAEKLKTLKEMKSKKEQESGIDRTEEAHNLLSGNAKNAIVDIKSGKWIGYKDFLLGIEESNKNRKTVLAAIKTLEN